MSTEPPPFAAQLRADLPEAAVRHVLGVFQTEITDLARTLRDTVATGDPVAFAKIAHRIAGSAGAVGATALEQGARRAMKTATARPDTIADMATEIVNLSDSARGAAASLLTAMG